MLTNLYIENIAIIEKSSIDFSKGLNVMTGETGAGKSIIIGAINAILGKRISKDIIRTGANSAFVSASFENLSQEVMNIITGSGYALEDDGGLLISREVNINGKNSCYINGRPANLSFLKEIGENLINIHGQHDSIGLLSVQSHILYIDKIGGLNSLLNDYKLVYNELANLNKEIDRMLSDDMEKEQRIDLLKYQIEEIESANLEIGEFEDLTETKNKYLNSEKIAKVINDVRLMLDGTDEYPGALKALESAVSSLDDITDCFSKAEELKFRMDNVFYELEDCSLELNSCLDDTFFDKDDLERIEERLDCIYKLKRKYGKSIEEVLEYLENAKVELSKIENSDLELERLKEKQKLLELRADKLANELSNKRKVAAEEFSKRVKAELMYLDMPNVNIYVNIENCEKYALGKDKIEFLISTNYGESAKPLAKIASGGELSRIMLSIKNVLASKDDIDTMIFDEVDTGISGSAAQKVGLKLKEVSKDKQVICVTHLAQIAALGDSHLFIKKIVEDERTYTKITKLAGEERKYEIARIIGGIHITNSTLENAKEMLEMGQGI